MAKQFVSINDFSTEEVNEMFNFLSEKALGDTPVSVKRKVLKMKTAGVNTKVSLDNLLKLIEAEELEFELKVFYNPIPEPIKEIDLNSGLKEDIIHKEMEAQKKEIKQVYAPEPSEIEGPEFNPGSIPDFN